MALICPALSSTTWPAISRSGAHCVKVMADDHAAVTLQLPGRGIVSPALSTGPALADAVARIECEVDAEHPAGVHLVVIGRVIALDCAPGDGAEPFVFFRGRYRPERCPSGAGAARRPPASRWRQR